MKIEEEYVYKREKGPRNKVATIIAILILVTIVIVAAIAILIMKMEDEKLAVIVNGQKVSFNSDTFMFVEGTSEVYVSIADVASLVGYEAHNGEYKINSEDTSKMYVEAKDGTETTSFYLNSRLINKVPPDSDKEYETVEISAAVTDVNGKLYVNAEGFMKGFNSLFSYDKAENDIIIQTLPYLVQYYNTNITTYGYDNLSKDFNNQKALIYGMVVASKQTTGKFGVINTTTNREIISPRYNEIQFIESAEEFIITNSSGKVGIAHSTGETKIEVQYDEIKVLDSSLGYYLVKSNDKYGVINADGDLVIHIEYDKIGVSTQDFPSDNIENQYVLGGKLIPVCLNGKWGLFDIEGKRVSEAEYDQIGSVNNKLTDRVVNNAMVIGETGVIVVKKEDKFGGINEKGDLLLPLMFEYIYSITSGGETTYYMTHNGIDYKAQDMIDLMKKRLGYEEENKEGTNSSEPNTTPSPSPEQTGEPTSSPEQNENTENIPNA